GRQGDVLPNECADDVGQLVASDERAELRREVGEGVELECEPGVQGVVPGLPGRILLHRRRWSSGQIQEDADLAAVARSLLDRLVGGFRPVHVAWLDDTVR